MLFNTYEFIFLFLPITLILFYASIKFTGLKFINNTLFPVVILIVASLFYYGWYNPTYLLLIIFSVLFNYSIGYTLAKYKSARFFNSFSISKLFLLIGISINLMVLAYFKYANFFIDNFNLLAGIDFHLEKIILPLAISFFTFQQIAFLVDTYKGKTKEHNFLHYCLFVTFFPQLIAGPIVHHKDMMPQFEKRETFRFNPENLSVGATIFIIGLLKKVIIADSISVYATPVFIAAEQNVILTFFEAWGGTLAYSFQIYFDFSGYSDMAIGLARMFGILIPLNFNSPYKSLNIIEFWKCWHMTLSRFLKNYLYIPLGGNRKGKIRRNINLMITMLLGGLWHGAGWPFLFWGMLHGMYLVINHGFRAIRRSLGSKLADTTLLGCSVSRFITFTTVNIAWVFFRAESFTGAQNIIKGMSGLNGFNLDYRLAQYFPFLLKWVEFKGLNMGSFLNRGIPIIFVSWLIVWYAPNTQELMSRYKPAYKTYSDIAKPIYWSKLKWNPSVMMAIITALVFLYTIINIGNKSEFIYYQF